MNTHKIFPILTCIVFSVSLIQQSDCFCLTETQSATKYLSYNELHGYLYENRFFFEPDTRELIESGIQQIILDYALVLACIDNDQLKIDAAISLGATLENTEYWALEILVRSGNISKVELLLLHFDIPTEILWRMSCQAIIYDQLETLHVLLNSGSPLYNEDRSLLVEAIDQRNPRIVQYLLDKSKSADDIPYPAIEIENILNHLENGLEQSSQQRKDIFSQLVVYNDFLHQPSIPAADMNHRVISLVTHLYTTTMPSPTVVTELTHAAINIVLPALSNKIHNEYSTTRIMYSPVQIHDIASMLVDIIHTMPASINENTSLTHEAD